jgi:hypothetical protein
MNLNAFRPGRVIAMLGAAALPLAAPQARAQESLPSPAPPPCRMVGDVPSAIGAPQFIRIDPASCRTHRQIGLDRAEIFARMAGDLDPGDDGLLGHARGQFRQPADLGRHGAMEFRHRQPATRAAALARRLPAFWRESSSAR